MAKDWALTTYRGPAGDHNDRAMAAVDEVESAIASRLGLRSTAIGEPAPARPASWDIELERVRAPLQSMAARIDEVMSQGRAPVTSMTRCAVALATQPVVLKHRPDTVVVWLDAHGDINVPDNSISGYLGGMALSGPMGWWDSGFGGGLPEGQAVLVGARDLDVVEQAQIEAGRVALVPVGDDIGERLAEAIAGRPVYLHIDCDVFDPGLFSTDYVVPGGLTLEGMRACAAAVAESEVVGVEVAEFEGSQMATADELVRLLDPIFTKYVR